MPKKTNFVERLADKASFKTTASEEPLDATSAKVSKLATATSISAFVATACLIFAAVTHANASKALAQTEADLIDIVVAAETIPSGSTVEKSMLTTISIPSEYVGGNSMSDIRDAVGKQAVVRIDKNTQVRSSELTKLDGSSSLAGRISKGKKAVSIDVTTESDFAQSLLHQGDRVTLYCFDKSSGRTVKKTIAKNVEVLALDGFISYADMVSGEDAPSYSTVSVEVSSSIAVQIRQIQSEGTSIWMVLTSSADIRR